MAILIALLNAARFIGLDVAPPGFEPDEASNVTHVVCLRQTGADADGQTFPLFAEQYGREITVGVVPPTNLYVGLLWESVFGHSVVSMRALPAFLMTMMTLGIYLLARLFLPREGAMLCALAASASPWAFQLGRWFVHTVFQPVLLVFWMYFFLRSHRVRDAVLSSIFLSLMLYSYPSAPVHALLVIPALLWMKHQHHGLDRKFLLANFFVTCVGVLPLIVYMYGSGGRERVNQVAIFGRVYLDQVGGQSQLVLVRVFLENLGVHFDPNYLFLRGDRNLRHSTQVVGQFSWLDTAALFAGVVLLSARIVGRSLATQPSATKHHGSRPLLLFCVLGYLAGVVPAALTWEGIPHALRSAGAMPFLVLLTGVTLWHLARVQPSTYLAAGVLSALFAIYFLSHYFLTYPTTSRDAWFAPVQEAAEAAGATGDWRPFMRRAETFRGVGQRYFLMEYGGEDCRSSQRRLQRLRQRG